jgi:hypothetical protein
VYVRSSNALWSARQVIYTQRRGTLNLERSSVHVLLEARDEGLRCEHLSALESSEGDAAGEVHQAPHAAARIRVVVVDVEPAARRRLPAERADAALIGEESSVVGPGRGRYRTTP